MPAGVTWQPYALLIVINLPVYILLGRLFFSSWDKFVLTVYFWIKPDILNAFSGEFWEAKSAEFWLFAWFVLCALTTFAEVRGFPGFWAWLQGLFA